MGYIEEKNIIGSLLMDNNSISEIYSMISPDMFTSELLGRMYLEFLRGYDNRYEVTIAVLLQRLSGESYPEYAIQDVLKSCVSDVLTSATIKSDAYVLLRDYKTRKLRNMMQRIVPNAGNIDTQISDLIRDLEALQDGEQVTSKSLPEIVEENKDKYFCDREEDRMYIGFPKLDDLLGGLEGGDMIVIGARPGVGKSALVTQITSNMAASGKRIGFYNLEMQEKQVYERFVVAQSGIGLTRLRRAKQFLGDEKERFDRANDELMKRDGIVITTGSKSMSEIRSESRHMGYDVIIIDYLQLLKADKSYRGNRYAEVGAISKAIKSLAMELNIPIIALSQLNRVSEARETKEPTMAELREAGDIEQDASVIILLWNISQEDNSRKGCKIEKQRQGRLGKEILRFDGDLMRFVESNESVKEAQEWAKVQDDDCPFK